MSRSIIYIYIFFNGDIPKKKVKITKSFIILIKKNKFKKIMLVIKY